VLCRRSLLGSPCPCNLARQIAFIRSGGRAISCTACKLARPGRSSIVWRRYKTGILIVADAVWGCYLSPGTTMVCETRIFAEIGLFDTKLQRHEDWDWLLRLTARYDLAGRAAAACAQRLKRCNRAPLGLTNTRQSNPTCEGAHAAAPTGRADRRLRKLACRMDGLNPWAGGSIMTVARRIPSGQISLRGTNAGNAPGIYHRTRPAEFTKLLSAGYGKAVPAQHWLPVHRVSPSKGAGAISIQISSALNL
jgi:hypothetical protein